ncbi:unnamed protein product [Didymodactylos carnosus]|uniref:SAM domain-containing protein n=1 Tax=Didymodactylos carnosus TaxID=1234261 RepID=A0A8S2I116_9BILA|nr:unnamed protein product [Didymodactylos carnosus]CAF3704331.1 unnamed protein product [Didymodactylos carnosus]
MERQFAQELSLPSSSTAAMSTISNLNNYTIYNTTGEQQANSAYAQLIAVPWAAQPTSVQSTPPEQIKRGPRTSQGTKQISRSPTKQATILSKPLSKSSTILPQPQKAFLFPNQLVPISAQAMPQLSNFQTAVTQLPTQQSMNNPSQTVTTVRTNTSVDMQQMQRDQQQTSLISNTNTMNAFSSTAAAQRLTSIANFPVTTSILNPLSAPAAMFNPASTVTSADIQTSSSLTKIAWKAQRYRRSSSSSTSKKKRGRPRLYERDPLTNKPIRSRPVHELADNSISSTGTLLTTNSNPTESLLFPHNAVPPATQLSCLNPAVLQQITFPTLINSNNISSSYLSFNSSPSITAPTASKMNIFSANNTNSNPVPFLYNFNYPTTTSCHSFMTPVVSTPTTTFNTHDNHLTTTTTTVPLKNLQLSSPSLLNEHGPLSLSTAYSPSLISKTTTIPNIIQLASSDSSFVQKTSLVTATNNSSSTAFTTSSSSSTDIGNIIQKQNEKPSAIVHPNNNIISHYIDGFVIRESDSPFVSDGKHDNVNISKDKENNSDIGSDQLRCDYCKKLDFFERFYGSEKKFCSRACSTKVAKLVEQKQLVMNGENTLELKEDKTASKIQNVSDLILRLTKDSHIIKQKFYDNEINGRALLLITPENLKEDLKIKLGPSLIISNEIEKLRHHEDNIIYNSYLDASNGLPTLLTDWTIEHVGEFILNCTGKQQIKDMFYKHEIDGEALLLMQYVHLRQLGINLGSTLVIFSEIEKLRAHH